LNQECHDFAVEPQQAAGLVRSDSRLTGLIAHETNLPKELTLFQARQLNRLFPMGESHCSDATFYNDVHRIGWISLVKEDFVRVQFYKRDIGDQLLQHFLSKFTQERDL